ncbi:MAG TPA: class I SAM-dependent methyltransferase [Solirubrobacterales bacterium]|nr:class I SAM-dependent methyltransferase [Solirubrobacterales bacterium]
MSEARHPERCAWCGGELGADADRLRGRIRCRRCGAATTDPWPDDAGLEDAYGTWYRPEQGGRFHFAGDALLGRTRGLLAARIDSIAPPGPVLDVGAGDGVLLDALRARGRRATGLERNSARPDFEPGPIETVGGDGEWAAVVLWHALEHLPRPRSAVREAARLLKPGGVLAIAVPNGESMQAEAFGDEWLHLDIPRHLVHLSTTTLSRGLAEDGFRVERVSSYRGGQIVVGWLAGLVGRMPGNLDLYQAMRRPEARSAPMGSGRRAASILAGVVMLPVAAACSGVEIARRRGGTIYVEARLG